MKTLYKIFKYIIICLVAFAGILYAGLYLLLHIPAVQQKVKEISTAELSKRLGVPVSVGEASIYPFDKVALYDVFLPDQHNDTLLYARKVMAGIELSSLLHRKLTFTTAHLLDFDIHLTRENPDADLNFQFVIEAFRQKEKKEKSPFDVQINTVVIRRGNISYDLLSEPPKTSPGFDKNHISVRNFLSTISLKSLRQDSININVRRLSFEEKAGFALPKLSFKLAANSREAYFSQFSLQLKQSLIALHTAHVDLNRMTDFSQFCDSCDIRLAIDNSRVVCSDFAPFAPVLHYFDTPIDFSCLVEGTVNHLELNRLQLNYGKGHIVGTLTGTLDGVTRLQEAFLFGKINDLRATPEGLASIINNFSPMNKPASATLTRLGTTHFQGEISGFFNNMVMFGNISANPGKIDADLMFSRNFESQSLAYQGSIKTSDFDLHQLLGKNNLFGQADLNLNLDGLHYINGTPTGQLSGQIGHIEYNGYSYENIELNGNYNGSRFEGTALVDDENGSLSLLGIIDLMNQRPEFNFTARGSRIRPEALKLTSRYRESELSFLMHANFTGNSLDNAEGELSVDSVEFTKGIDRFFLEQLRITAHNETLPQYIHIRSDILNGEIAGQYSFRSLKNSFTNLIASVLPAVVPPVERKPQKGTPVENSFNYSLRIEPTEELSRIFELPVTLAAGGEIEGFYNDTESRFRLNTIFPSLKYKKRRFDHISLLSEKNQDKITLSARASNTNKKNKTLWWSLQADAHNDQLETRINWSNTEGALFCGELSASTRFRQTGGKHPLITTEINPTHITLNDSIWKILPATIWADSGKIAVEHFEIRHDKQYLHIDGIASKSPEDEIDLRLNDVSLDYIFESLNLPRVIFGGQATGNILLSDLLSGAPRLNTKKFYVKNFSYNNAVFGDLNLYSQWENESQGILLQGSVSQPGHPDTGIYGHIFPTKDSLHLSFDAHYLNLEFLQPFVGNILTGFTGRASGKVDFYGKFNALTVTGNAYGENVKFGVDYLNTVYTLSDSIHLTPNAIQFENVTVADKFGRTGMARGLLQHNHFKDMTYDIGISDVRNMLVFNVTEQINPVYYGTVFGSGTSSITGDMTRTNIHVNMKTEDNSKFTFVLSNTETASDYPFITFVNKAEEMRRQENAGIPSVNPGPKAETPANTHVIDINLQVDATPEATMQIVMDPATGDLIKANGTGGIRLEYNTFADMKMYGTYTLEKGSYSFNLQDLITRVFNIKSGSSISFRGDPLEAYLDITAIYSLTANLTDLSESFAEEKELSRTSVPVNTVLKVSENLQQPDLKFDIEFPTLTQDIDRQVRSIISTEEMMNRQIIYLLALGKFYTPDYMNAGQSRSNELASVASSTLSSQLNNMLGQISDKLNIGTNIRSDKGDFSDVEVELALSSQLLNNRLILNGNFGYRDNQVNSNAFVGDFDLEYLLNKSGNMRLKAYNHYNDRNYYIKSALTTQGVGVMFKRDFGRLSEIFRQIADNMAKRRLKREEKRAGNQSSSSQ